MNDVGAWGTRGPDYQKRTVKADLAGQAPGGGSTCQGSWSATTKWMQGDAIPRAGRRSQVKKKLYFLIQEIRLCDGLHWEVQVHFNDMTDCCQKLNQFVSSTALKWSSLPLQQGLISSEIMCSNVSLISWLMMYNNHSAPLQCTLFLRGWSFLTLQITPWHPFLTTRPGETGIL